MNNPMGLNGFDFVEFSAPEKGHLEAVFARLGFSCVAQHRSKDVQLWRQADINFIANYEPGSSGAFLAEEHGPCASGMAFRVTDAQHAYRRALALGAQPVDGLTGPMELRLPAIRGIGGAPLYLIDRYDSPGNASDSSIYDIDFEYLPDVDRYPPGVGLQTIDHLTHNVYRGRMDHWAGFYEKYFNFREIRHFDIKGQQSGLISRAMTAPDNKIRIPLNEEARGSEGQIEAFLTQYKGEGIQHIALSCSHLPAVLDRLRALGLPLMAPPPDAYYDMLEARLPGHGEPVDELRSRGILLDGSIVRTDKGSEPRLLLQIFSEPLIGPIFFEFIERKRDEGFGEGNFQALFESMEASQMQADKQGESA